MLQLLKPACTRAWALQQKSQQREARTPRREGSPLLTTTGEGPSAAAKTQCSQKQVNNNNKKEDKHCEGREARAIDPVQPGISE